MPEVLTEPEQAMCNAVSELQSKVLLSVYFVFQYVNSSQGYTTSAFCPTLETKSLLLPSFVTAT